MSREQTTEAAYAYCQKVALGHYENFPVASILLPESVRAHIFAVYAFARYADDLADEHNDRAGLIDWQKRLHHCLANGDPDPVLTAVSDTISKFSLPVQLFDDLISAFLQDLEVTRYPDMESLLDYCRRSANPIGRLVLLLHRYSDPRLFHLSDSICTALQLANFWQDVKVDLEKDRIYIPRTLREQHQVTETQILERKFDQNFAGLMKALTDQTRQLFYEGIPLLENLDLRLRLELRLTIAGGLEILNKIDKLAGNTLESRPAVGKLDWFKIALKPLTFYR